jgi:hypothetical protein
MAGKRHHYLPQFVQRGFAIEGNKERIWVYRKGQTPRESGIRDTGVEVSFYSEGADTSVDEAITEAESNEFDAAVKAAGAGPIGPIAPGTFPRLFAHLEVRSRNLRQGFLLSSEYLWKESAVRLRDPNVGGVIFKAYLEQRYDHIVAQARHALRSKGLPAHGLNVSGLKKRLFHSIPRMTDELERQLKPILPQKLREAAKKAHLNALRKSISPEIRIEQYQQLNFCIQAVRANNLILGDCGVAFHIERTDAIRPFVDKDEVVIAAILPVAPSRAVVGKNAKYDFNPDKVRIGIARSSLEFFVAAEESDTNKAMMTEIGLDALPISKQGLSEIISEIMEQELLKAAVFEDL